MPRYSTAIVVHSSSDKSTLLFLSRYLCLSILSSSIAFLGLAKDDWSQTAMPPRWYSGIPPCRSDKVRSPPQPSFWVLSPGYDTSGGKKGFLGSLAPLADLRSHFFEALQSWAKTDVVWFCLRRFSRRGIRVSLAPLSTTKNAQAPRRRIHQHDRSLATKTSFIVSQTIQNNQYTGT